MLTIILSDTLTIGITFAHPTDFLLDETRMDNAKNWVSTKMRYTHCEIYTIDENGGLKPNVKLIADGLAKCALGDNFQKRVGRKIALTRALKKTNLLKAERQKVWIAYLMRNSNLLHEPVVTH